MPDYEAEYLEADEAWTGPHEDDVIGLWRELRAQWSGRNMQYRDARAAYDGDLWEGLRLDRPANRFSLTANYLKTVVEKDVQLVMGQLPGIQVLPPSADKPGRDLAERLEGLLYGNWELNKAHAELLNMAWNSIVLRRGLVYYWWDPEANHVRWRSLVPDNFYPVYDGTELFECVYVSRRLTRSLQQSYPDLASKIYSNPGSDVDRGGPMPVSEVSAGITDALQWDTRRGDGFDEPLTGYTTVIDYYDRRGAWVRIMAEAVHRQNLGYPCPGPPVIEIRNSVRGDEGEPHNAIDQLIELQQYYNILLSMHADVIGKYANPPIIDEASGQSPAKIHTVLSSGDGGVLPVKLGSSIRPFSWEGNQPDFFGQMSEVKDAIFDLSGKPRSSYGQTVTNQSGVVTNLTLTPTLQSNELRETVWGAALSDLNGRILKLYEAFSAARYIEFNAIHHRVAGAAVVAMPLKVAIKGSEIQGWYQNRMKWPSAIRVDDPVYVDTQVKLLSSQPQAQSLYDTLENLGVEDVEAAIDRIRAEREDPRIHPEVLEQTINSLSTMAGMVTPGATGDLAAGVGPEPTEAFSEPLPEPTVDTSSTGEVMMAAGELQPEAY